jgi:hypothetical protein
MNEDILKISYEDLLRDPDLIDRVQRDARRYRAREVRRVAAAAWRGLIQPRENGKPALRTAACG